MRHSTRLFTVTMSLAIGFTVGIGVAAPASATSVAPAVYDWQYGGRYYDSYDCTQAGLEFVGGGSDRAYRCLEEVDSGGGTAYYNLCLGYWVSSSPLAEPRPAASNPCAGL